MFNQWFSNISSSAPGRFPQFVDVLPHGEHSAYVVWRGVDIIIGEAPLNGYKVQYYTPSTFKHLTSL